MESVVSASSITAPNSRRVESLLTFGTMKTARTVAKEPVKNEDPQKRLKDAGLRRTPVRVAVLEILDRAESPLDAPSIVAQIDQPNDAVTVYRTLNTFTRKKLIHRMPADSGWRYAIGRPDAKPKHHHPHFICDECGEIECVKDSSVPASLLPSLHMGPKYTSAYAEVIVHGTCDDCHRKRKVS